MSKWRARALELFPDMRTEVESADSVGALWIELIMRLQHHYDADEASRDDPNLFRSICLYATWCKGADSPKTPRHVSFSAHNRTLLAKSLILAK